MVSILAKRQALVMTMEQLVIKQCRSKSITEYHTVIEICFLAQ